MTLDTSSHAVARRPTRACSPSGRPWIAIYQVDTLLDLVRRLRSDDSAHLTARRRVTDDQLTNERNRADSAVAVLDETQEALARAEGGAARRSDVLGMVAHDLRSPLAIIAMNAQNIDEVATNHAVREAAQDVSRAAARMDRLLTDLLDVARIDSGTLHIVRRKQDVASLFAEVVQSYRPLLAARSIAVDAEVAHASTFGSFDHDRIVQVLSNLLGNSLKFVPANGHVTLRAERHGKHLELTVRDNGPGIDASAMQHLFERFAQADTDARRGLGLGLHICQKLVEAHGGTISAESELGRGTTIRFTLPVD